MATTFAWQNLHRPSGDLAPFQEIADRVLDDERIDESDALFLLREANLSDLCALGDTMRHRRVPGNAVTFVIDTNPNYTNICVTDCLFCAFYRKPGDKEGYWHSVEDVVEIVRRGVVKGATTTLMQGGHNPEIPFSYYLEVVRALRKEFPDVCVHLWSPSEIRTMSEISGLTIQDVLQQLWDAGQRTIPGGGAEILVERVRKRISPKKSSSNNWLDVMRAAHKIGFKTTATMMYGHAETDEEIVEHLRRLRELQDDTGGFTAFIPWSFKPGNTLLEKKVPESPGPVKYLRIIALARIYLDNFRHIQASWFSEGKRTGQIALHAGGDDFGGTLIEENVLAQANHHNRTTTLECVSLIKDAGFGAIQRTTPYEHLREW